MGRATILQHLGEAQYRVQIRYDRQQTVERLAKLDREIAAAESERGLREAAWELAVADLTQAQQAWEAAVAGGSAEAIAAAEGALVAAQQATAARNREVQAAALRVASLTTAKRQLEAHVPADHEATAWCADYTTTLTGDVGTVELGLQEHNLTQGTGYLLRPAGGEAGGAAYNAGADGGLAPTGAQLAEQGFYNYAVLPGMERWRPRYRAGTITAVDEESGLAAVNLAPLALTHQRLNVNAAGAIAAPVSYMGLAPNVVFEVFRPGDEVLIELEGRDWARPRIVGFTHDPKPPFVDAGWAYDGALLVWHDGVPPFTWEWYDFTVIGGSAAATWFSTPQNSIYWMQYSGPTITTWFGNIRWNVRTVFPYETTKFSVVPHETIPTVGKVVFPVYPSNPAPPLGMTIRGYRDFAYNEVWGGWPGKGLVRATDANGNTRLFRLRIPFSWTEWDSQIHLAPWAPPLTSGTQPSALFPGAYIYVAESSGQDYNYSVFPNAGVEIPSGCGSVWSDIYGNRYSNWGHFHENMIQYVPET